MVTTQWHPTPSTQRQSLVDLSTQRWLSVYLPAQKWLSVHLTAQRQLSGYSLDEVCDVLYCRPLGWDLLSRATEGHPPHLGGHSVHLGYPNHLIFYNADGTHGHYSRPW